MYDNFVGLAGHLLRMYCRYLDLALVWYWDVDEFEKAGLLVKKIA